MSETVVCSAYPRSLPLFLLLISLSLQKATERSNILIGGPGFQGINGNKNRNMNIER